LNNSSVTVDIINRLIWKGIFYPTFSRSVYRIQ